MIFGKLPRLAVNWFSQAEVFKRYWDQVMNVIEALDKDIIVIKAAPITVADLASITTYNRAIVNDSNSTIFADIVVGGGTDIVPVYFDGIDWRIG